MDAQDLNRLLVDHSLGLLCIHDLAGQLHYVNPAAAEALGYPPEELVGKELVEFLDPPTHDAFDGYLERIAAEGSDRGLMRLRTSDGSLRLWSYVNILYRVPGSPPLVLGSALDVTERVEIENELRAGEERYRSLLKYSAEAIYRTEFKEPYHVDRSEDEQVEHFFEHCYIADCNDVQAQHYGLERREQLIGTPIGELLLQSEPRNVEAAREWIRSDYRQVNIETRERGVDGEMRHFLLNAIGVVENGVLEHVWGTARDVTELWQMRVALTESHEAIRDLAGRLLTEQESERRRISRELHDVLNQRLAVLAMEVGHLRQQTLASAEQKTQGLDQLQVQLEEMSSVVRQISHELHPATLEHLGLVAALRAFCREFSEREGIRVELETERAPESLPTEVALCLYRVAQECLRNVAKHSGSTTASVVVFEDAATVHLEVTDDGVGFDPELVERRAGLGLVSIEERARFLNGTVVVDSAVGRGTSIEARVPRTASREGSPSSPD